MEERERELEKKIEFLQKVNKRLTEENRYLLRASDEIKPNESFDLKANNIWLAEENKQLNEENKHLTSLVSDMLEPMEPKEAVYLNGHQMTTLMQGMIDEISERIKQEQGVFRSMNIGLFYEEDLIEAKDLLQKVLTLNRLYLSKEAGGIEEIVIRLEKGEEKNA